MIVVLGRPGLTADDHIGRSAGLIALAAAHAGGRVELVGSVGDDPAGDAVIVELGRAGIGHAAVLRDPAGVTPRAGETDDADEALETDDPDDPGERLPRLDAADVELGLAYLAECQVLVAAETLPADVMRIVSDAATYHGAALIVLAADGQPPDMEMPETATVLAVPTDDGGAFAQLVGRYAALLDAGRPPVDAWSDAVSEGGWEPASA